MYPHGFIFLFFQPKLHKMVEITHKNYKRYSGAEGVKYNKRILTEDILWRHKKNQLCKKKKEKEKERKKKRKKTHFQFYFLASLEGGSKSASGKGIVKDHFIHTVK